MELKKCSKGHTYDPTLYAECPECARLRGETIPLNVSAAGESYGKTEPVGWGGQNFDPMGPGKTQPVNHRAGAHWADQDDYMSANLASEGYAPTMPLNFEEKEASASQPVTGWLVCIDGPSRGLDYRLHAEYNYIGRSSKMDVCIQGDPTVSRENHAIIAYDSFERIFYFAPASGASIVRVNGKAVLSNTELHSFDKIQIGKSTFLFVAFCGEQFQWEQ